jgi:predicted nucleotidyltransferase
MGMAMYSIIQTEKEKIENKISHLLRKRNEIIFSYIHGSFLEGNFRDVDVAVYLKDEEKALQYEIKLEREIEDIIGFPADVRVLNHAPLSFRFSVITNGILLFSKNEKIRCDFESLSIVEYHDFNYLMNIYRREALGIEI